MTVEPVDPQTFRSSATPGTSPGATATHAFTAEKRAGERIGQDLEVDVDLGAPIGCLAARHGFGEDRLGVRFRPDE